MSTLLPGPRIVDFPGIRLAGFSGSTSFSADATIGLWARFIATVLKPFFDRFAPERYSVAIYPEGFFESFSPGAPFEKWAAAPFHGDSLPVPALRWLEIPAGTYAVFEYAGPAAIFNDWLPRSGLALDLRPHFEILPPGYRPEDPDARESVYIPVKPA